MGDDLLGRLFGDGPLTAIIVALLALVGVTIKAAWDRRKGKHDAEIAASKDRRDTIGVLKDDIRHAESKAKEAHAEMVLHRERAGRLWEYAHKLRQRLLCMHQESADDLPPWPDN